MSAERMVCIVSPETQQQLSEATAECMTEYTFTDSCGYLGMVCFPRAVDEVWLFKRATSFQRKQTQEVYAAAFHFFDFQPSRVIEED